LNDYLVLSGTLAADDGVPVAAPTTNLAFNTYKATRSTDWVELSASTYAAIGGPNMLLTLHVLDADVTTPVASLDVQVTQPNFVTPTKLALPVAENQVLRVTAADLGPNPGVSWSGTIVFLRLFT
jgi:hypothetical protein